MSCCANRVDTDEMLLNREIERRVDEDTEAQSAVIKLLILGSGDSGKSTLFKQLIAIHGKGFSESERKEYSQSIYLNCISSVQKLITESELLPEEFGTRLPRKYDQEKQFVAELDSRCEPVTPEVAMQLRTFWKLPEIQQTYLHRTKFQLPECCKYYLDKLDEIEKECYVPTEQDVLRCRIPTTGVVETEFYYSEKLYRMYDVGGQRNERKKWIHCFESVTAMIFVASMSEYDLFLFEDSTINRMTEALLLFDEICNSPWFQCTSIILFLNKSDIFAEKILKSPLEALFPDYTGGPDFEKGATFLQEKFKEKNRIAERKIYSFITNATDTKVVRNVFGIVSDIIIRKSLNEDGLL